MSGTMQPRLVLHIGNIGKVFWWWECLTWTV